MRRRTVFLHPSAGTSARQVVPVRRNREQEDEQEEEAAAATTAAVEAAAETTSNISSKNRKKFFNRKEWMERLQTDIATAKSSTSNMLQSETSKELLHRFNAAKDSAQRLMGLLAVQRGVPLKEIYAEFGLAVGDE